MTNEQVMELVLKNFGWTVLLVVILLMIAFWSVVHWLSEPGKEISFLRGIVSYTKRHDRSQSRKNPKPIAVIEGNTNTLWRIATPIAYWIDSDLNDLGPTFRSTILLGPYHAVCKKDLSYFDVTNGAGTWRIRQECTDCDVTILPEEVDNSIAMLKMHVLQRLQQLHLQGTKIRNGIRIP